MFRRKSFALLKLFQNIQELFTKNVPNNRKCSVEKVLHFWNCSRTFKNFLPKIFQINGNIPKHCKVFPRNVQSKSFLKNVHETLQNCFKTIIYVLQTFQCLENILSCLSTCPDCSIFQSLPKLLVCLKTFQSVLEYFKFVLKIF